MFNRRQFLAAGGATALAGTWPTLAWSQSLETARVVVGFPAGGTTDAVSRRLADKMRSGYAKVALVENKAGAGGRLAAEMVKSSPNDGSTLLLTPASIITLYPHIFTKLTYKIEDFTPVSTACIAVFGFGVGPMVPDSVKTLQDYLAWAKANPGKASFGSPGAGTPPHFLGALLAKGSGVELQHVPYRGSAPGIQDLIGGQVGGFSGPIGDFLPHLKTGKLRMLATSGHQRTPFAPDVPTYSEQGFKNIEFVEWYGVFLPGKASPEVVQRAAAAVKAAVTSPDVIEGLATLGLEASANTPEQLKKAVATENAAWGPVVKTVGFTPEA
ncbi:Bug family tripartite tricarboxylate transporter substrate binding protein [Piscinibacter terrae]|uniref:Twin-arginine translocation pathway signal protein n=1 Tax=Piscinibacter terrae TaxID=2496871 RepID=A0A3N7J704_9BURK|nr:Bug family tripartite tricarboxylate transporter substrate binding protein [Albitalea terrae]RQP26572.1 twin-arginine translocation pathway signal protein [Albitalea terrae]